MPKDLSVLKCQSVRSECGEDASPCEWERGSCRAAFLLQASGQCGEPLELPPAGSWGALLGLLLGVPVLLDFVFKQIWYQSP